MIMWLYDHDYVNYSGAGNGVIIYHVIQCASLYYIRMIDGLFGCYRWKDVVTLRSVVANFDFLLKPVTNVRTPILQ